MSCILNVLKVLSCYQPDDAEEMLARLLKRGETSGRIDDNVESIKKRFKTFIDTSYPVIEYYQEKGQVKTVS